MAKIVASLCLVFFPFFNDLKADELVSKEMPSDALVFFETKGISEFLIKVRDSTFFQSLLESGDFDELKSSDFIKEVSSTFDFLELFLRKDIWVLNERLLSGRMGVAAYEAEDPEDPNVVILIKPKEASAWLKNRIRFAPLIRLGIKRIGRTDFEKSVYAYRTRGDKNEATYFALNDEWIIVTSSRRLLKDTVSLQGTKVDGAKKVDPISKDIKYSSMIGKMGTEHQAAVFLNTRKISKIDGRFGIPEKIEDPMLSLFLGGVVNQLEDSSYAGLVIDFDGEKLNFSVDMEKEREAEPSVSTKGIEILLPPKIPGYLGGISVYQPFSKWHRERNDLFQSKIIPGSELLKGKLSNLLFGASKDLEAGYIGDGLVFLSALADDAGKDENGISLPGFCFLVDLNKLEGAESSMHVFFEEMLSELNVSKSDVEIEWTKQVETHEEIRLLVARSKKSPEKNYPTPNCFQIGSRYCFSSSLDLSFSLIKKIQETESLRVSNKGLNFNLDFNQLTKFFSLNKKEYLSELSRARGDEQSGQRDFNNINSFLSTLQSLSGTYESNQGRLGFDLEAIFNKTSIDE